MENIGKNILHIFKKITHTFNKLSLWGKLLLFIIIILFILLSNSKNNKEGFVETNNFLFNDDNNNIYDDFYANIYDTLTYNKIKDNYEVGEILNKTNPTSESIILDIGSGTGHISAELASKNLNVTGIDKSSAMINRAKEIYPDVNFRQADLLESNTFQNESFTHILCMYFTIYYFKDKNLFFKKCFQLLKPGGFLVIHLVERSLFDPMLNAANPLITLSPQRYAKTRINKSKITFDDFKYNSNFVLDSKNNKASFIEKFEDRNTGKIFRKNEHKMYMETEDEILEMAEGQGFIIQGVIDLMKAAYDYQYLYILVKPN